MKNRKQRGSAVVAVCVALLGLGVLGGVYWFFSGSRIEHGDRQIASEMKTGFAELRDRTQRVLADRSAIQASMTRNPNAFACLFSSTGNCSGQGGLFQLFESSDPSVQPFSQIINGTGLGYDGMGCSGFPKLDCPLRVETEWKPVCASGGCEATKSFRVKAKVQEFSGSGTPEVWEQEELYTPDIQLSESAQCARQGLVWTGSACAAPGAEAQQRANSNDPEVVLAERARDEMPQNLPAPQESVYVCPDQINVQGLSYTVEYLQDPNRAQVRVPAMNGCPAEDVFVFQCSPKSVPQFANEGQWIQVEASMAPACDPNGVPIGQEIRN